MVDAYFRAQQQKSIIFQFLPIERTSMQDSWRRALAARHSSLFDRYQSTQTGNSLRLLRFGGV
jgi:hypothetical protein